MHFADIKAITFDAGGTLIEPWPSVGEVYAQVAAEQGCGVDAAGLNSQFAEAWKRKQSFDYSRAAWQKLVEECFSGLLRRPVSLQLFNALYQRFAWPDVWHVYDDVRPTLQELRQRGYRLGIISNWDLRLELLLERLELRPDFDAVVLSVNVGANKPSQRIFQEALAVLKLPPTAVLHVGDGLEEDVEGAAQAGFAALLLSRGKEAPQSESISSLTELLALLP